MLRIGHAWSSSVICIESPGARAHDAAVSSLLPNRSDLVPILTTLLVGGVLVAVTRTAWPVDACYAVIVGAILGAAVWAIGEVVLHAACR